MPELFGAEVLHMFLHPPESKTLPPHIYQVLFANIFMEAVNTL
jgi:hypothetical protein